jgi:hypothetical protein
MTLRAFAAKWGEVPYGYSKLALEWGILERHRHLQPFIPSADRFERSVRGL